MKTQMIIAVIYTMVVYITAMIIYVIVSFSAVQMYGKGDQSGRGSSFMLPLFITSPC